MSQNYLFVRTPEQKILMDEELKGQISDGMWENNCTDNRLWNCEVKVSSDNDKLGCNFVPRFPLEFNDELLIKHVGDRMVRKVQNVNPNYTKENLIEDLKELTHLVFGVEHGKLKELIDTEDSDCYVEGDWDDDNENLWDINIDDE